MEKQQEKVSVSQFEEEVFAMLKVCFECKAERAGGGIKVILSCGDEFFIKITHCRN